MTTTLTMFPVSVIINGPILIYSGIKLCPEVLISFFLYNVNEINIGMFFFFLYLHNRSTPLQHLFRPSVHCITNSWSVYCERLCEAPLNCHYSYAACDADN